MIRMIEGVDGEITDHPLVGDHVCNVGNNIVSSAAAVVRGARQHNRDWWRLEARYHDEELKGGCARGGSADRW